MKTLYWNLPPEVAIQTDAHTAESQTYYAPGTNLVVQKEEREIHIAARKVNSSDVVRLQMAFYLDDLLSLDAVRWSLNGHEMEAKYEPQPYD